MRVVHLTDIHIDSSETSVQGFINCLRAVHRLDPFPDLILFGGDLVRDALVDDKPTVEKHWERFQQVVKEHCRVPYVHCLGNHDVCAFEAVATAKQFSLKNMGLGRPYYSFSKNNWRFIVLDSIHIKDDGSWYEGRLDDNQWLWLKAQLENFREEKTIILSHIPILSAAAFLDGDNVKADTWVIPGSWIHLDSKELVHLFSHHPQIKLCLSGHLHLKDRVEYNGISFACNGAVSGNWWKGDYEQTPAGFAVIDLTPDGNFTINYLPY